MTAERRQLGHERRVVGVAVHRDVAKARRGAHRQLPLVGDRPAVAFEQPAERGAHPAELHLLRTDVVVERAARQGDGQACERVVQGLGEPLRGHPPVLLHEDDLRREAAALIVRGDIEREPVGEGFGAFVVGVGRRSEDTHPKPVAVLHDGHPGRQLSAYLCTCVVAAIDRHHVAHAEQGLERTLARRGGGVDGDEREALSKRLHRGTPTRELVVKQGGERLLSGRDARHDGDTHQEGQQQGAGRSGQHVAAQQHGGEPDRSRAMTRQCGVGEEGLE